MELKQDALKHESGGLTEVTAFGLDSSSASVIIGMLTRQYSDPEMAFIRETSSNAYDAHIAAGKTDVPFDIHVPSAFAPHVEIRDYGTGLSKEFMLEKYTQVGHSTKRTSNTQIGGFGIGRLSFLIVTEQAAITSYYNGMKYSFNVSYDKDGQLLIALTDERETTEPNGLRLKFPVQTNRVDAFRAAASKYFSRVSATMPNFTGADIKIDPPQYSHKTEHWGIRTNGDSNMIYAMMGNIAYPIRTDTLKYDTAFNDVRALLDSRIDLFFEIGEVIPVPTRENLDMCQHTLDNLLIALKRVKADLVTKLETEIATAKNRYFAYKVWNDINRASSYEFSNVIRSLGLNYKGESVYNMRFDFQNVMKTIPDPTASKDKKDPSFGRTIEKRELTFHSRRESSWNASKPHSWQKETYYVSTNPANFLRHVFIYNDVKKGIRPTIDFNLPNKDTLIHLVGGSEAAWKKFKAREIERGMSPKAFRRASKLLPKPKTAKAVRTNVMIDYLYNSAAPDSVWWGRFSSYKDIANFDKVEYYVKASNFKVEPEIQELHEKYRELVRLGLLDPIQVVIINKKNEDCIGDDWLPLSEYVKVDAKKISKQKKKVTKALEVAMQKAFLEDVLSDKFETHKLTTTNYGYHSKGYRQHTTEDNAVGKLLKDSKAVLKAVESIRNQVSTLSDKLETYADKKPLVEFVRLAKRNGWMAESVYTALADSYEIDYPALRATAAAETKETKLVVDFLNSQTYLVVRTIGGHSGFDLAKLKKEISK